MSDNRAINVLKNALASQANIASHAKSESEITAALALIETANANL